MSTERESLIAALHPDDGRHGTENAYGNLGCRCDSCRAAHTAYHRERKTGGYAEDLCACGKPKRVTSEQCLDCYQASIPEPQHGTESGYKNLGCRCEECRGAMAKARAERRRNPNPAVHGSRVSYANGCRCAECREAHRIYSRDYKRRRRMAAA